MSDVGVDWEARVNWDELRRVRIDKMKAAMKSADIGGVIVQRFDNLKYLTSLRPFTSLVYYPRYAAFLPREGEVCLLTEAGDFELDKKGMPWIHDLRIWSYDITETVETAAKLLKENGLTDARIAYDDVVSPSIIQGLKSTFPSADFVDGARAIGEAKAVKHPEELKIIRKAAEIAEIGMAAALEAIKEGVKECEVAGEATRAMFAAGADVLISHPQISTDPLRRMATDKRIRHGELVLVDLNIGYNGYIGDFARTTIVGTPSKEQKNAYRTQLSCVKKAISLVKHGTNTQAIQDSVKEIVESAGLQQYWHSYLTGHGVGTGFAPYEQPIIGTRMGFMKELKAGMVIAFEPGIFKPGVGPVRVEEMILTTANGHELLTRMPYEDKLLE